MNAEDQSGDPSKMDLPAPELFTYYLLSALLSGPFIVLTLPALWFRYSTLKYSFEDSGLRMNVGVLFRRESVTAYRRIQDIHVSSNVIQRWLGISTISIQTASGSAAPEIVIEGVKDPEELRDWLYERLRGAKGEKSLKSHAQAIAPSHLTEVSSHSAEETTKLLTSIRDNLSEMLRIQESRS